MRPSNIIRIFCITLTITLCWSHIAFAQAEALVNARMDASRITVGDQARVFIEAQHNAANSRLQWATIPDSFNRLEVIERGKIDTTRKGDLVSYRQRVIVTGFDSGMHTVPSFAFTVIPSAGDPYLISSDSLNLLVQTVAVDTAQGFRGIKGIMLVETTWKDYIWYILGALLFLSLAGFVIWYFRRNERVAPPAAYHKPPETLQEKALRFLDELERENLWQNGHIKEYYSRLTDILRQYIEERYHTPAMELTTDELLQAGRMHHELRAHLDVLSQILYTADMAKFARAEPTPQEHTAAMENARRFINDTTPVPRDTIIPAQ